MEPKKVNGGLPRTEDAYPPREGWGCALNRSGSFLHSGYTNRLAKPCKCGGYPVFEQYINDSDEVGKKRRLPATQFVAICPICERRAPGEGSLDEMLRAWNSGKRTADSEIVNKKAQDPDTRAVINLSDAVVKDAIKETIDLIHRRRELMKLLSDPFISDMKMDAYYIELQTVRGSLRMMQEFFKESPILFDKDGEAVMSQIRKAVYPELTYLERTKIPLDLVTM